MRRPPVDDASSAFDEDVDTDLTGAIPLFPDDTPPPEEDDTTVRTEARCARCLRVVKVGGDIRPSFEAMAENAPDACYRAMSSGWTWCSGLRPWTLVLTG